MTTMTTALEQKLDTLYDYYEQAFGKSRLTRYGMKVAFENGMKKGAEGINLFLIDRCVDGDGNDTFLVYADVFTNTIKVMSRDDDIYNVKNVILKDDNEFMDFIETYGNSR